MISPRLIYSIYENRLQKLITKEDLPKHIGLIHDGIDVMQKRRPT